MLFFSVPFYPIFPSPIATFLALGTVLSAMLALLGLALQQKRLSPQTSRRLAHVTTGTILFYLPFVFQEPVYPIVAALAFALLNAVSIRFGKLRGIHAIDRPSYGTVYFPLAYALLAGLFWDSDPVALQIGVLLLTLADPIAGWAGQRWGRQTYALWSETKSGAGTAAMWISSLLLAAAGLHFLVPMAGQLPWSATRMALAVPLIASTATIAEIISHKGSDNLSVPLTGGVFVALMAAFPEAQLGSFALWASGSALLLALAQRMGSLDWSGTLAAWVMGNAIFLTGGWGWLWPLMIFFISGSLLSQIGGDSARQSRPQRDVRQVMANGGAALLLALAAAFTMNTNLYIVYLAAIAASAADTWATETGKWSRSKPRSVIGWRKVEPGSSGGMTWLGTAGSLAGAAMIPLAAAALGPLPLGGSDIILITAIGFGAAVADSILGATVQARYQHADGSISEDRRGIAGLAVHSGWSWMDNNMVNLAHTGLAAWVCWLALQWMEA
ncbi:MAG: DUF92 domain-containing protein [Candidatus Marinimicrobia bacterium]|nr:DUF92 domain-containing protein [Candidatus Neomarinimicrobiota bacterium]